MAVVQLKDNPLAQGFYTPKEAAKLVEFSSTQKVYGWLRGWPRRKIGPVLQREFEPIEGVEELSFLDLMEIRFVRFFRDHKVKWSTLHLAAREARNELEINHPFASDKIFKTDGDKIYLINILKRSAEEAEDKRAIDLITKQYQIFKVIENSLIEGVDFDPVSHMADRWYPRPNRYPEILIDPLIAYGRPVTPSGIPTEALYDAWLAEEKNFEAVASWYEVSPREVRQAVGFHSKVFENESRH
jgi:uncharacterized protein (DUF433 family)